MKSVFTLLREAKVLETNAKRQEWYSSLTQNEKDRLFAYMLTYGSLCWVAEDFEERILSSLDSCLQALLEYAGRYVNLKT